MRTKFIRVFNEIDKEKELQKLVKFREHVFLYIQKLIDECGEDITVTIDVWLDEHD